MRPLRICIDARIPNAEIGGAATVVIELARAFSKLDGNEEYHFYTFPDANDWIRPHLKGPCRILEAVNYSTSGLRRRLARQPRVRKLWHTISAPLLRWYFRVPTSDGTVEREGFDLIHFTQQHAFLTCVPSIYQPHDLQHLHLPECFTTREMHLRRIIYPLFCERADMVVAMSKWGKDDLVKHFRLPHERVQVVPWGSIQEPPQISSDDLANVRQKFELPEAFLLFPAQTWAHKNHIRLLEALAHLKKDGINVPVVCSGKKNEFFSSIKNRMRKLGLNQQVRFLGFVSERELQCLYRLARALIFPSRFEGWGLPISEAFASGLPVVCSNVTCLPSLVADAALLFSPDDTSQIAAQIERIWTDEKLCHDLISKGKRRNADLSWDHTARLFRAHYRRLTQRPVSDEDRTMLAAPPLV